MYTDHSKNQHADAAEDNLHDDDLPVGHIFNRRELLALLGVTGLITIVGCGSGSGSTATTTTTGTTSGVTSTGAASESGSGTTTTTTTTGTSGTTTTGNMNIVATPQVTEGPFFVDENLNRAEIKGDTSRASVINGLPLTLSVKVYTISGTTATPLVGAHVDVWHADAVGTYSDESNGSIQSENTKGQNWLRGYQVTDANGAVNFTTIYPSWYQGRTIHIHFKVREYNASSQVTKTVTSQFFFDDSVSDTVVSAAPYNTRGTRQVRNTGDSVYNTKQSDGMAAGFYLLLTLTKNSSGTGYTGTFNIGITA